jgi:hypothetical protein
MELLMVSKDKQALKKRVRTHIHAKRTQEELSNEENRRTEYRLFLCIIKLLQENIL